MCRQIFLFLSGLSDTIVGVLQVWVTYLNVYVCIGTITILGISCKQTESWFNLFFTCHHPIVS